MDLCRRDRNPTNLELANDTSTIGYAGLQLMKGKIIVIDNQLATTRNLVIKEKYVIAHTTNIQMRWFDPLHPHVNVNPVLQEVQHENQPVGMEQ